MYREFEHVDYGNILEGDMENIAGHFGEGFLQIAAGAFLLGVFLSFMWDGGILNEIVQQFINGICG